MARASAFQAEGRGFESRFPLQGFLYPVGGFVKKSHFHEPYVLLQYCRCDPCLVRDYFMNAVLIHYRIM